MSVSIGSLFGDDQRMLEDLELLPPESPAHSSEEENEEDEDNAEASERLAQVVVSPATVQQEVPSSNVVIPSGSSISRSYRQGTFGGIPWFEEMVEGSRLGRMMKTRRGVGISDDQSTTFEWEVSEWTSDGSGAQRQVGTVAQAAGKRKRGQHTNVEDIEST